MSNNIIDKIQLSGVTYDIGGQGGSGVSVVEVTQAEYDALPSSAKTDTSKMYVITDAEAGDLTNYYTKTETNTLLGGKADTATTYTKQEVDNAITAATATKQDTLVSGTNIKSINNESILGSGNIEIGGGGGSVNVVQTTGTSTADVMSQDAVSTQLNNKANKTAAFGGYGFGSSSDGNYIQYKNVDNSNIGNSIYYPKINGKDILTSNNIYARNNYNFQLVETSAITTAITSSSTDVQVPSAKAVYDIVGNIETLLSQI